MSEKRFFSIYIKLEYRQALLNSATIQDHSRPLTNIQDHLPSVIVLLSPLMTVKKYNISKCQGNYDRQRNYLKELFIFRIYDNISWTGKVTVRERVKYRPQYSYFDEDCMEPV